MQGAVQEMGTAAAQRSNRQAPGQGQEGTSETSSLHHVHCTRAPVLDNSDPRDPHAKPGMPSAAWHTERYRSSSSQGVVQCQWVEHLIAE